MVAGAIVLEFRIHGSVSYYPSGLNPQCIPFLMSLALRNPRHQRQELYSRK